MKKVRVIRYRIHAEIVVDDGENLSPLPVQPIEVAAADLPAFMESGLAKALEELQAKVNTSP